MLISCYEAACSSASKSTSRSWKACRRSVSETASPMVRRGRREVCTRVRCTTETCRRFDRSKTMHGLGALFDTSVFLLQTMIEVLARPMLYLVAHCLTYSPWRGTMPICRDRCWRMANHSNCLLKTSLRCCHIPFLAHHGSDHIAIVVDRSIEIPPLPMHACRYVSSTNQEVPACPRRLVRN